MNFTAKEIGTVNNGRVLTCGASNTQNGADLHYFNFQRSLNDEKDSGIYFEFDDQGSGDYNRIVKCVYNNKRLKISLQYGAPNHLAIDVEVSFVELESSDISQFIDSLKRVFLGYEHLLELTSQQD